MTTPNPLAPVKGATTTLWIYSGSGNPFANPLSDVDWTRLAKIKDLQPGELTAESNDDTYLDDEDADWTATAQGQKSAGRPVLRWPGNLPRAGSRIWFAGLMTVPCWRTKSNTRMAPSMCSVAG